MQIYSPSSLLKGAQAILLRSMQMGLGSSYLGRVGMLVSSNSDAEQYSWLGETPRMRQLADDDELVFDGMSDAEYEITNQLWASGLVVKRRDLDDQKVGTISTRISQLAQVAMSHVNRIIINTLVAGTTGLGYDSTAFFSDAHPARGQQTATQDNLLTSAGFIADTVANARAGISAALGSLGTFVAENGEPFTEMLNKVTIVCSVTASPIIHEALLGSSVTGAGALALGIQGANFPGKTVEILETPRVTGTSYYVLNTSNPSDLPIILQQRDPLELTQLLEGDAAFDREMYKYKARWRGAGGYAHWQNAVFVTS